jgi:hypothetical protein
MAFSPDVLVLASMRSEDQCECEECNNHEGRCQQPIHKGKWEAWKLIEDVDDESVENCELICLECADYRRAGEAN